ncbi:flap endonuclease-1, partial [Phenoliferia sp. Uapishka_3]
MRWFKLSQGAPSLFSLPSIARPSVFRLPSTYFSTRHSFHIPSRLPKMLSVRAAAIALFASAIGASAISNHHGSVQKREIISTVSEITTTLSTAVNETQSTVTSILASVSSLDAASVVSEVVAAVEELVGDVDTALSSVQGLVGDVVEAVSGDSATDAIASDLTSILSQVEAIISALEQQLYDIPGLSAPISTLAGLLNGPLSDIILGVDEILVGVLSLVGNLSMSIYQFLIAVRTQDGQNLMNDAGETTSHLQGLFGRTIRMVENDLKPMYVFDGKPPDLKQNVLKKRFAGREEAKEGEEEAKETGTSEDVGKLSRRQAPSEAEAQCAELCRGGMVYAAGSEDMDTLTFNSNIVLRHLTFSEARKEPIDVISLADVLAGLELTMDQFIDMCMLCGCDYLEPIRGIGAKTAYKLVKEYDDMEDILKHLRKGKNPPPEDWPYEEARELFKNPNVLPAKDVVLEWKVPDVDGLVEFMVKENGFSEDRIRKGAEKLRARLESKPQGRLDSWFTVKPKDPADIKKRKGGDEKPAKGGKKAKTAVKKK